MKTSTQNLSERERERERVTDFRKKHFRSPLKWAGARTAFCATSEDKPTGIYSADSHYKCKAAET